MSNNYSQDDSPAGTLKNESARQRWELFHRAIAHAKQSNSNDLLDPDSPADDAKAAGPVLTIVR